MLDLNLPAKTLASLIPKEFHGSFSDQLLVSDIQIDSRKVTPGALFIALQGIREDGKKYVSHAIENGAVAILVEDSQFASVRRGEVPIIGIPNLKARVADISEKYFDKPSEQLKVIGVTGTNGKSTIVSLIAQLGSLAGRNTATIGTLGYGLSKGAYTDTGMTTPDVVQCHRILAELLEQKAEIVAMEVSSHGIDQARVENVCFDVGIISNITRDHLDYHSSFDEYARVKRSFLLSEKCQSAVVNADDKECYCLIDDLKRRQKQILSYGLENSKADLRATINHYTSHGMEARIQSPWGIADVSIPLVGAFNLSNLLAAVAANCIVGLSFDEFISHVAKLKPVDGRLQRVLVTGEEQAPEVFIDYAHTPDALKQALLALRRHTSGKLWLVFGCGGDRDRGKRSQMGKIAQKFADRIIVTSDNPRTESPSAIIQDIIGGIEHGVSFDTVVERDIAILVAIGSSDISDCVLIAGKGHEDYQLIGNKKILFSDYLIAQRALQHRCDSSRLAR